MGLEMTPQRSFAYYRKLRNEERSWANKSGAVAVLQTKAETNKELLMALEGNKSTLENLANGLLEALKPEEINELVQMIGKTLNELDPDPISARDKRFRGLLKVTKSALELYRDQGLKITR